MRKMAIETTALAALLLGAALAFSQQPAPSADKDKPKDQPAKSKLEEMLEKALKDNPDVRLAAAKLSEAEAELHRARLQVVQQVASAYQAIEAQKAAVDSAAAELDEVKAAVTAGAAPTPKVRAAEQKLIDAKAKLSDLESQLPYLLGQQPAGVDAKLAALWVAGAADPSGSTYADYIRRYYLDLYGRLPTPEEMSAEKLAKPSVQGPTADRIRAALDKPFTYEGNGRVVSEVIGELNKTFQEASQGLVIKNAAVMDTDVNGVTVHFDHMPIGAALEWVEDTLPKYRVAIRDYGLVIAPKDELPPGAPLLHDFWKGAKLEAKDQPSNPSAKVVQGDVKDVDKDGHIHINIGKNDGLAKGDALTVFRIRQETEVPLPLFIGRVRVVELGDGDAVAEPFDAFKLAIVPGDKVRRDQGK